jgi:crossover junction endodeoxyribonuclease RuvC
MPAIHFQARALALFTMKAAVAQSEQVILGIDPGTLFMGYGLIAVRKNSVRLLEMGVLRLARQKDHAERLRLIYTTVEGLIQAFKPAVAAIEAPFFGKNVQSMLKLGRAQGVAIAAATVNGLAAIEYSPNKVKQCITGRGHATKEQVWRMLQETLNLGDGIPDSMDATDALAVALCHHYQSRLPVNLHAELTTEKKRRSKKTDWAQFAAMHPERVG